ncbi:MAG: glycosyltransferase family 4 protein [Bacteroidales bacterium]
MKILLINHYAGGPDLGMEHRPWFMAREWIRAGHQVNILAAGFAHTRTHQPGIRKIFSEDDRQGVPYGWIKAPAYKGNGVMRLINIFTFITRLGFRAKRLAHLYQPDVVIASSTYPLDIWPAHRIARHAGAKLVYEVHDLWPLSPMELGGYSARHPFIALLQRAENFAYQHADLVPSLLPHTLEHMVRHGMKPDKFVYIPNGIPSDEWDTGHPLPAEHQQIIEQARAAGQMIVGYTGAHGIANALTPLLEAAALIRELPVTFLLVGSGPEKENLRKRARELGLTNINFTGNVQKKALPALLDRMDVLYVGFQKQSLYRFGVSPNKLFDYMMAGKPVIQAIRAGNDPVAEAGCGLSIEPDDPRAIAGAIEQMFATDAETRKKFGEAGKAYVLAHHDYRILAEKFITALGR